ncbi:nuclear transcription factor y, alpha [Trichoderma arundinaceum]|uniref:Transcriptional activator HAP2 n=1 Tax=Trichoderma arundinaceum TaxID=490622 RepID=A0A395NAE5_TRIAR|nr:nuclear transcription factor y, alpha [Trichoderma arundinaceum]
MEYAQYPQQQHSSHAGYANSTTGASITSPTSHGINQHAVQSSPIVASQQQQQPAQAPAHGMYQPQYGVPQPSMQPVPYGMPGIQAAAMAATAAASGSSYPYMHSDPSMPHTSPRMPNAKKDGRPSPRMNNISQIPGRRMSQVTSPGVPSAPGMMNHGGPRPPPMPPAPAMQHPQSPEMPAGAVEESPLYVNAKQFHRILKRRVARQRLEEQLRLTSKGRKPYLHESRHNHAMRRPRGPGGRFLTAEEVAAMDAKAASKGDGEGSDVVSPPKPSEAPSTKRKSESGPSTSSKKPKTQTDGTEGNPEDDS